MDISAQGLRAVVTAGAGGIGRAIAEALLANGARVQICDISDDALHAFGKVHPGAGAARVDVADPAQVERFFEAAAQRLGGLDLLVNNAGIAGPTGAVETIAPGDWDRTMAVNINGQFYCARRAVPLLKAAGGGSIVNISSVAGRLGFALRTPYAASKWAVIGFTQSLAIELGPANIRVNAILPGVVEGDRIERVIKAKAEALGIGTKEMRERMLSQVSMRRTVSAGDIAAMVLFLVSAAGRNISGQALSVDGNVERLT